MINNAWEQLTYSVHPGEILREYLEDRKITQLEFSKKTGINKTIINEIINGKRPITIKTALILERFFSMKASFWNNLQMIHNEINKRIQEEKK